MCRRFWWWNFSHSVSSWRYKKAGKAKYRSIKNRAVTMNRTFSLIYFSTDNITKGFPLHSW
jgi:hypothetical protein